MTEYYTPSNAKGGKIALAIILPIILVGAGIGIYYATKPKLCPDGSPMPIDPVTGKKSGAKCKTPPPDNAEEQQSQEQQENGGNYGYPEPNYSGKCSFPLQKNSGHTGDANSQFCVAKVKEALKPYILSNGGWFDEDVFGETVQSALDDFVDKEVTKDDKALYKLQNAFNSGCGMFGFNDNCKLYNDQYKELLEKKGVGVSWNNEFNQWR